MQQKILLAILALVMMSALSAIAEANTPYELTTNYPTGTVPLGDKATVTATTIDPQVNYIDFTWVNPNGKPFDSNYCWTTSDPPFESTQTLNALGTWKVYVSFVDNDGAGKYQVLETQCLSFDVRHTTINTVPEVPIGTIGIALAMFLGFTAFIIKKKTANPKRLP